MAMSFDELTANASFTKNVKGQFTLLPDPPRADREYLMISCDDHIVEPPDTFTGRVPKHLAERAPRVIENADGSEQWLFDGELMPNVGFNAVAGRPVAEYSFDPTRFDQMRKGSWDVASRIDDMNLDGVYGSLCFPSFIPGFAGQRLYNVAKDTELAVACTRAWNDWMLFGKEPPKAGADCKFQSAKLLDLGKSLGVSGTPTTFFSDGRRMSGAISKDRLEQTLSEIN